MNMDRVISEQNNKIVYLDGERCIKAFGEGFSKADVLNEALNQARAEEIGLHVPKVLEVTSVDGRWAIISEYIPGKTLAQLIEDQPEKKPEYIEMLVDLQMMVHEKKCTQLTKLKDKMNRRIADSELDATTRYDIYTRLEAMPKHVKVCHGDFNPSNVIIAEDGTPYILDWAHATQGNASADIARTYLLFWLNGDISGAEMYLDAACRKSDTPKRYVQQWMAIVAASRLIEGNEKEHEFLRSWVDSEEYR